MCRTLIIVATNEDGAETLLHVETVFPGDHVLVTCKGSVVQQYITEAPTSTRAQTRPRMSTVHSSGRLPEGRIEKRGKMSCKKVRRMTPLLLLLY